MREYLCMKPDEFELEFSDPKMDGYETIECSTDFESLTDKALELFKHNPHLRYRILDYYSFVRLEIGL